MDYTYFSNWISPILCQDGLIQGKLLHIWNTITNEISSLPDTIIRYKVNNFPNILIVLLEIHPKVKNVIVENNNILVYTCSGSYRLTDENLIDFVTMEIDKCNTEMVKFIVADYNLIDYNQKISNILELIYQYTNKHVTRLIVDAIGYDRLFLIYILKRICNLYIQEIDIDKDNVKGKLYISLKSKKMTMSKLNIWTNKFKNKQKIEYKLYQLHLNEDYIISLSTAWLVYNDKNINMLDQKNRSINNTILMKNIMTCIDSSIQNFSSDFTYEELELLKMINNSKNLVTLLSILNNYNRNLLSKINISKEEDVSSIITNNIPYIQLLARYKSKIEKRLYIFDSTEFGIDSIRKIEISQCMRSIIPIEQVEPLIFIKINRNNIEDLIKSNKQYFKIFKSRLRTGLKKNASSYETIRKMHYDNTSLQYNSQRLHYIFTLIYYISYARYNYQYNIKYLIYNILNENELIDEEDQFVYDILKSASFSAFGYADTYIRILTGTLSKTYKIKYQQPQENPTCEIFVCNTGDFLIIRTAIYLIKLDDIIKGNFIVKYKIENKQNNISASVEIVSINLFCPVKEQLTIYEQLI